MGVKQSKRRWRRLGGDVRATCFAPGCEEPTRDYCRTQGCRQPFCSAHKGDHVFTVHTMTRLVTNTGAQAVTSLAELPRDRQIELLSLLAKVRRRPGVSNVGYERIGEEARAWATRDGRMVEALGPRVEEALHALDVELRPAARRRTPNRQKASC